MAGRPWLSVSMSQFGTITLPYATTSDQRLIHITAYRKGTDVGFCIGCGEPLIARQGSVRQWHYAHHGAIENSCSGEGALHRAAKLLIKQSFDRAFNQAEPYSIHWHCSRCNKVRQADCTKFANSVELEAEVIPGVRADLLFRGKRDFCVEIVVTHEIETTTKERYEGESLPVFIVRPTWDSLKKLERRVETSESLFLDHRPCPGCQALERQRRERDKMRRQLRSHLNRLRPKKAPSLTRWEKDARGNQLYPRVTTQLLSYARTLLEIGFRQTGKKPWLFMITIPNKRGVVFANLGGTDVIPIWKDSPPLIHWQLKAPEWHKRMIVHEVMAFCARNQLPTRLSFYNGHYYPYENEQEEIGQP